MNAITHLLGLPRLAWIPSWRSWVQALIWPFAIVELAPTIPGLDHPRRLGVGALVFAVAAIWGALPDVLWLAREAESLRIPRARQEAERCLLLYALLGIVVPAVALGLTFGHALTWLVSLALVAGMVFAPRVLSTRLALVLLAALIVLLFGWNTLHIPLPGQPGYLAWVAPVALALGGLCALRWHTLLHADLSHLGRWQQPNVGMLRNQRINILRGGESMTPAAYPDRASGASTRAVARVGPAHPIRSIRLAIDPVAAPNAQRGLRYSILIGTLVAATFLILLAANALPTTVRSMVAQELPTFAILFLSGWVDPFVRKLAARWSGCHGELPLLALLPGLGAPGPRDRATFRAGMRASVAWSVSMWVVAILVALASRTPHAIYPLLVLVAASGIALNAAIVLHTLAGRLPDMSTRFASRAVVFALLVASVVVWQFAYYGDNPTLPGGTAPTYVVAMLGVWCGWLLLLLIIAWGGWRELKARPHPFLANPPQ